MKREDIVKEIISETTRSIPQIANYRTGGVFHLFIEVVASFLEKIYCELERSSPNRFLQTATGKYLDLKAEELGLTRNPAIKTRGYIVFSRADTSRNITINKDKILATRINSQGKVYRYKVLEDTVILESETTRSVLVEAEEVGKAYNALANQITEIITPISGVDTITNSSNWIVQIGQDIEPDNSLRLRCLALWKGLSGANKDAYISWAKEIVGVESVKVLATARGLGTVDIIFTGANNIQPNAELIEKVQNIIDMRKPIATDTLVKAPSEVVINTSVKVIMHPNIKLNRQKIEEAIQRYFATLGIGSDIEPSALSSVLFTIEGVKSCEILAPNSTRITDLQIARLGSISINLQSSIES